LVNERFLLNSSASRRSTMIDEELHAKRKILKYFLITQLADDSGKKYEFLNFFEKSNF
jgi:hypothetical protein